VIQSQWGDEATCAARVKLACPPGAAANGSTLTSNAVEACVHGYEAQSCGDYLSNQAATGCTITGSTALGTACAADDQCASGYCQTLVAGACGICATRSPVGGACFADSDCEQTGLTCPGGSCVPLAVLGAACDQDHPCQPVLCCSATGMCVARLRLGAACDPTMDNQCDSTTAVYCNPVTSLCVQAQFSPAGGPCGNAADGTLTLCAGSGLCQSADGSTMGTCQAVAADGAACDPVNGPTCLPPATCLGTACALLDPTTCH